MSDDEDEVMKLSRATDLMVVRSLTGASEVRYVVLSRTFRLI
jgi:hypothetical protein